MADTGQEERTKEDGNGKKEEDMEIGTQVMITVNRVHSLNTVIC